LDDERLCSNGRINDCSEIQNGQIEAGDEILAVEGEESGFSEIVEGRTCVVEEEIHSDSNFVAICNQSWEVEDWNECCARQSVEIFNHSFEVVERSDRGHSSSDTGVEYVVEIHLAGHDKDGSRGSESKIEVHDFLLADCIGLLLGNVGFAFGSINAVWNSVLINDLSWSNALLAIWVSISPEDLIRTSALVAGGCIPNESQVSSAFALSTGAQDVVEVVGERLALVLLTARSCSCNSDSDNKDKDERLDRHYNE